MIATDPSCLTDEQLRDVAHGRLPPHRFTRLLGHLESCSECQSRADAALGTDDSLAAALAIPPTADPLAAEAECIAALYHAASHHAASHHESPADSSGPPVDQLGPYRLIRPLGSGGMGAVFLAEHTRLRRRCAIKLLPRDRGFDAAWRDRFDREMAAVAALDHQHIVSASDAGEADGWHYLVMEYLDGLDLSRLAGRLGELATADACELVRQASMGLAHIHASGLIHRDIKPSNLMLTRDGIVKILDLGLVVSGADPLPAEGRLTTVGQLMGTLAYMAPEQLIDSRTVDHRCDLYALGATLYRLLTGVAPHGDARGLAPLVIAKTGKDAPAIAEHRSNLPTSLVELVTRLLDPAPERRPQTALEVAQSLEPFTSPARPDRLVATAMRRPAANEESVAAAPTLLPQVAGSKQPPNRRRWGFIAAAAALPLLLLGGIVIFVQTDRGQLVIESDQPGLTVAVEQGEEVVEQLQLETGENRVTLRSGTYTVTLDTPADGLRLSNNTAAITRGGETILRVRREESLEPFKERPPAAHPLYQGKTLDEWLAVLEIERDVTAVSEAMEAVIALGKEDAVSDSMAEPGADGGMRAAHAVLRAARRFGGITSSRGEGSSPSQQFMHVFMESFPALLPEPGIEAISRELADGNEQSATAAIWMLYNYATGSIPGSPYLTNFGQLEQWRESESGRDKLRALAVNLNAAVERLGGYQLPPEGSAASHAVSLAYQIQLRISSLLGATAIVPSEVQSRLQANVERVANYHKQFFDPSQTHWPPLDASGQPAPALAGLEVAAAAETTEPALLAWAAVPHLLTEADSAIHDPAALYERLSAAAPTETADATVVAANRIFEERHLGGGLGGFTVEGPVSRVAGILSKDPLWPKAITHASQFTTRPQLALAMFHSLKREISAESPAGPSPDPALPEFTELHKALEDGLRRLAEQLPAAGKDRGAASDPDAH